MSEQRIAVEEMIESFKCTTVRALPLDVDIAKAFLFLEMFLQQLLKLWLVERPDAYQRAASFSQRPFQFQQAFQSLISGRNVMQCGDVNNHIY